MFNLMKIKMNISQTQHFCQGIIIQQFFHL